MGNRQNAYVHAWARVTVAGGAAAMAADSGDWDATTPVTYNGAGDTTLLLAATRGADPGERVVLITAAETLAASGVAAWGYTQGANPDLQIQVTSFQEQAAGAASIAVDLSYHIAILGSPSA